MPSISFEQTLQGIKDAWLDLDTKAHSATETEFESSITSAFAANDAQHIAPDAIPSLIAALQRDGWEISVDPNHRDWRDAAVHSNSSVNDISGLTNHCERRILLKTDAPLPRVFRTTVHEIGHAWGSISISNQVCKHTKATDNDRRKRALDIVAAQVLGGLPLYVVESEAEAELTALIVDTALNLGPAPSLYYLAIYRQRAYLGTKIFDEEILPRAWASASETAARILSIIAGAESQAA